MKPLFDSVRPMLLLLVIFSLERASSSAFAQGAAAADQTILDVEIMTTHAGGNPLEAQRWRQVFEKIDVGVRIRPPLAGDKPEVKESSRGTFRIIKVVGRLDRAGKLVLPDRTFTAGEGDKLKEWLDEMRVYGAQGSPEGKPLWGLNQIQFEGVHTHLSGSVTKELHGLDLRAAVAALGLKTDLPVVFHTDADEALRGANQRTLDVEVQGLSNGTALAVILSQWNLGYRPLRGPSGDVRLVVQPLSKIKEPWPLGWPIDDVTPRNQVVPTLFEMVTAGFEAAPLGQVLEEIEVQANVPIIVHRGACRAKGIDVDQVPVSYPRKRTAWSLIIQTVVRQARLTYEYRVDEAQRPFVYVYPFIPFVPGQK